LGVFHYDPRNRCVLRQYFRPDGRGEWALQEDESVAMTYDVQWNLLVDRRMDGAQTARYLHGARIDEILRADFARAGGSASIRRFDAFYPLADGLGSTVALADDRGRIEQRYRYAAFGSPDVHPKPGAGPVGAAASSPLPYRLLFSGREWAAGAELFDHRNRYSGPNIGRWLAPDPIRFEGGSSFYAAFGNSPVMFIDRWGLYIELWYGNHPVTISAGIHDHSKLWLVTDDASYVSASPNDFLPALTKTQPATPGSQGCSIWFVATGAGSDLAFDELIADLNRSTDAGINLNNASLVFTFSTGAQADAFLSLVDVRNGILNGNFQNTDLEYEAIPGASYTSWSAWDEFNSNSYISGLLTSFGIAVPPSGGSTPGYSKPIPSFVYTSVFQDTSALKSVWRMQFPGFWD
jgi:RHS repeat-associated protein